jgi:Protein of unknown function (DUF2474)
MSVKITLQVQLRRVGWLLLIWTSSVLTLGVVATLFRGLMKLAGLTA